MTFWTGIEHSFPEKVCSTKRERIREREKDRESDDRNNYLYFSCQYDIKLISYMT
jgi:hypothetical protein